MKQKEFSAMMRDVEAAVGGDEFAFLDAVEVALGEKSEQIGAMREGLEALSNNYQRLLMLVSKRRLNLLEARAQAAKGGKEQS